MIGSWRNRRATRNSQATQEPNEPEPKKTPPSTRDLFLPREIQELQGDMPSTCKLIIPNPNELHKLELIITPSRESMWYGGKFKFEIDVPTDYKYVPPKVRCQTRIYHPNINESGEVCLSILRIHLNEHGWMPTRSLKDVVCGLNSLFTDLLNFEDPLNSAAAEHYLSDARGFNRQVKNYIDRFCNF